MQTKVLLIPPIAVITLNLAAAIAAPLTVPPVGVAAGVALDPVHAVRHVHGHRPAAGVHPHHHVHHHHVVVVRPVRPWVHRPYYGTVVAGVALGTMVAVTVAASAPPAPAQNLCWYWADPAMSRGYWDYCK